jgi:hypothetical protein
MAGLAAGFAIFLNVVSGGALQARPILLPVIASVANVMVTVIHCASVQYGDLSEYAMAVSKVA